jgi:hypothetical protein
MKIPLIYRINTLLLDLAFKEGWQPTKKHINTLNKIAEDAANYLLDKNKDKISKIT